jgi:hypothetical protein
MKRLFAKDLTGGRLLTLLLLVFVSGSGICEAAEAGKAVIVPAGSLVMRGPKRPENAGAGRVASGTNSPEHLFGLQIEEAIKTNDLAFIWRALDIGAFNRRFVPSLPMSEELKEKLYNAPHRNPDVRQLISDDLLVDVRGLPHTRFLGTRMLGDDCALLFRDGDGTGAAFERVTPMYIAYIAGRQLDGSVRIVDAHRFRAGELMSHTMRRRVLIELAKKKLITGDRISATDQQRLSNSDALWLFDTRYDYGKFSLIKEAYDRLPPEVQNDRNILFRYATRGDRTITDVMVPVERWRRLYPNDPTPNLMVVDFYWLLYYGPRWVKDGPGRGTYFGESWTAEEESEVEAAIERANAWFADPRMEVRMAAYYGTKRPEKARPLLEKALKRFPAETITYDELLKVDLAAGNFDGVADTLHLDEATFHTNLTQMVSGSRDYDTFRKSLGWKRWLHDWHGADAKNLAAASTQPAPK